MSLRTLKIVLGIVVGSFLLATLYFTTVIFERQHALRRISRYNPTWQASQTLDEFMKLDQSLRIFKDSSLAVDKEKVQLRYEIFSGTAKSLGEGGLQDLIRSDLRFETTIRALKDTLKAAAPLIENLNSSVSAQAALQILQPLQGRLRELTSATYNHGAVLTTEDEQELTRLHWIFSSLTGTLIFLGLLLSGLLARHNTLLGRAHRNLHRLAADLAHMAHYDALTGLANRVLFRERLERVLADAQHEDATIAILYLDLDLFKNVNDTLGHQAGDALLKTVAERLRGCIRENDIIARLGGDEFAVLSAYANDPLECSLLASRIVEAVDAPFDVEGHELVISTSIGIAFNNEESLTPDRLLKHADLALYYAKADGRGTFRFFEPEMDTRLQARHALEVDLRKALANSEFELFFQPQINIQNTDISGFEALLRWRHPTRGFISPAEFIPIAEDTGLIIPLGKWVIERACTEAVAWPETIKVAINLSTVQFRNNGLTETVGRALMQSGLAPSRLELEITESALLQNNDVTLSTLHQLRRLGVRIAMDDFGTGYSSLSYLRSFPFDKIKIDQSFVREMSSSADCLAIVQFIARLGESLGMSTVAEGVETEDQFLQIWAAGCTEVQGFYFGRPKPADELVFSMHKVEQNA